MRTQGLIIEALKGLLERINKRTASLSEGEPLLTGEVEEFTKQVVQPLVQELRPPGEIHEPLELLR